MGKATLAAVSLAGAGLALLLVLRACTRREDVPSQIEDAATSDSGVTASRCTRDPKSTLLAPGDIVIGQAAANGNTYAIGLVRTVPRGGRRTAVALIDGNGEATLVDLDAAGDDTPPPQPFVRDGKFFAMTYASTTTNRALTLADLGRKESDGGIARLEVSAQQSDESLAFDVVTTSDGRGLVAWDEDADGNAGEGAGGRGVIKVMPIAREKAQPLVVSSSGSDVERPRGVARAGGGFWLAWIARRVDPRGENDPKALEGPGEDRSFSWVEIARLDADGKRAGEVRRITSDAGHVTAFDWLAGPDGKLDLFVRDDTESTQESEGGRILRIPIRDEGADLAQPIVKSGAGLGDPAAVGDPGHRWLFYADPSEHAHAIFLDGPDSATSAEPALDGQSILLARPGTDARSTLLLAVGPGAEGKEQVEAHILRCGR